MLEKDIARKKQIDENMTEFDTSNKNKKYRVVEILDSAVYVRKLKNCHLSRPYYLVF